MAVRSLKLRVGLLDRDPRSEPLPPSPFVGTSDMNVNLLVLDDVSISLLAMYDDVNKYASPFAYPNLPNLDALLAQGIRFNRCWASPHCGNTRATILTGRWPFRHGCFTIVSNANVGPSWNEFGTPPAPAETILPRVLFEAGAISSRATIGKWHLGQDQSNGGTMDTQPVDLGVGYFEGTPQNLGAVGTPVDPKYPGGSGYRRFQWIENGVRGLVSEVHASQWTRTRAERWLENATEPAFLYLPFHAPHVPLDQENWPPKGRDEWGQPAGRAFEFHGFGEDPPDIGAPQDWQNTRVRATLEHLDAQIGEFMATVNRKSQQSLTIVVGDNGTAEAAMVPQTGEVRYPVGHPLHQAGDDSTQLSVAPYDSTKFKTTVYEGGLRVPLIVSGPMVVSPNRTCDHLVNVVDLFATIAEATGASIPAGLAQDSVSFWPVVTNPAAPKARTTNFMQRGNPNGLELLTKTTLDHAAIREDGANLWKVIWKQVPGDVVEFYNVADSVDPLETNDLGVGHPEYAATRAVLDAFLAS